jgi:extracellular factor (EF) 3-hydroxypalmitic acid methyl ester biosynthesis protein
MDTKLTSLTSGARDSFTVFRNSQGNEARGTLLRLTRYSVVFEVYNPYSIVQLSEVLSDFRIFMADRMVYSGRGVVSSLVNVGTMLVCEASLDECWLDVDIWSPINQRDKLRSEFAEFMKEWQKIHAILPEFKVVVADMQSLLVDLRRWMEQVELGLRSSPTGDLRQHEQEVLEELREPIIPTISGLFDRFEEIAVRVDTEQLPAHRTYLKRQLHPLVLCSPFAYRTYHKPLGYAGDYEMVNMIIRDPLEGSSLFAKMVNLWFWMQAPAAAHRNRIKYLCRMLDQEAGRVVAKGQKLRILNLGCGPAGEVQEFLASSPFSEQAKFTLLDFNDETLDYTAKLLDGLKAKHRRSTEITLERKSVHQILKEESRSIAGNAKKYDLVYCAGLFDYLSDRICRRLMEVFYEMLAPGGLLVATNVDAANPIRYGMEYVLEWHLVYRTAQQLQSLAPEKATPDSVSITSDTTGVNLFVEVRKADDSQSQRSGLA